MRPLPSSSPPPARAPQRVLFVEVDAERSWAVASLGPAFIAPFLRERGGHETDYFRAAIELSAEEVAAEVARRAPDVLGLSLTTRQWQRARGLVAAIKARLPELPVVAGGLHPTFSPEAVLAEPGFDFACLGEGEEAMLELVDALAREAPAAELQGIRNIWAQGGPRPTLRPPFEPLDELPYMDRAFLDEHHGVVNVTTQRGCPFPCTYCGARMFNELYEADGESYGRRRTHQSVMDELRAIRAAQTLAYVIFLDDTFTIHHPWVKRFCEVYPREIGVPFALHARVETVNERLLGLLAQAGCAQITYGIESGSERIRREVMRRPVTNDRFRDVFRWTKEAGIAVTANYMLGLPEETPADLRQTIELARELDTLDFGYFVFYPYPGTALFKTCLERGYLPADYEQLPAVHRTSILDLPTLSQADIDAAYDELTELRAARMEALSGAGSASQIRDSAAIG